jgi:response regulator RpfG family c-di-GMP phosphodiesterase
VQDLRAWETGSYSHRVTKMTSKIAGFAGVCETELVHTQCVATLHDIGKMVVPVSVHLKPDKLSGEEWIVMREDPVFTSEPLSPSAYLHPVLKIPYCHHEKWEESG